MGVESSTATAGTGLAADEGAGAGWEGGFAEEEETPGVGLPSRIPVPLNGALLFLGGT